MLPTIISFLVRKLMHDRRHDDRRKDTRLTSPPMPSRRLATFLVPLDGFVQAELRIPADLTESEIRQLCGVIAANAKA